MFVLTGKIDKKVYTVIWDKGTLSGDLLAVELVKFEAKTLEGSPVGPPPGPTTIHSHLKSALSAKFIMYQVFDEVLNVIGDAPYPPDVPEGAIS